MYNKIMLLLAQKEQQRPGVFEATLASEGQRIRKRIPKGSLHRRAFRLADDPTRQIAHAAEMTEAPPAFEAVFEVGAPGTALEQLIPAVQGIAERLGNLVDPSQSAALAGTEHVIVPGEHSFMLVFTLRRLQSLTSREFHDYWLHQHAKVGRAVPGLQGYRQFHADPEATLAAARAAGVGIGDFEGAAEGYFRSLHDFLALMSQPEVTRDALEDEKRFIDHLRSCMGLYYVLWNMPV